MIQHSLAWTAVAVIFATVFFTFLHPNLAAAIQSEVDADDIWNAQIDEWALASYGVVDGASELGSDGFAGTVIVDGGVSTVRLKFIGDTPVLFALSDDSDQEDELPRVDKRN